MHATVVCTCAPRGWIAGPNDADPLITLSEVNGFVLPLGL
jgi:hypothetical protein